MKRFVGWADECSHPGSLTDFLVMLCYFFMTMKAEVRLQKARPSFLAAAILDLS